MLLAYHKTVNFFKWSCSPPSGRGILGQTLRGGKQDAQTKTQKTDSPRRGAGAVRAAVRVGRGRGVLAVHKPCAGYRRAAAGGGVRAPALSGSRRPCADGGETARRLSGRLCVVCARVGNERRSGRRGPRGRLCDVPHQSVRRVPGCSAVGHVDTPVRPAGGAVRKGGGQRPRRVRHMHRSSLGRDGAARFGKALCADGHPRRRGICHGRPLSARNAVHRVVRRGIHGMHGAVC